MKTADLFTLKSGRKSQTNWKAILPLVILITQCTFFFSCQKKSSNPITPQSPSNNFNDSLARNIRWDITAIDSSSRHVDISAYKRFSIVLQGKRIWATDGCNYMDEGTYEYHGDTLILTDAPITDLGCVSTTIPFDHLLANPTIELAANKLTLYEPKATYFYNSNFTADVRSESLTKNPWSMIASNDSNFVFFDSLKLYPVLYLNSDRTFKIEWHNRLTGEPWINEDLGVFSINNNAGIQITIMNGQYAGNGVTFQDGYLIMSVEQATSYKYENQGIRLINDSAGTYYDFKSIIQGSIALDQRRSSIRK